MEIDPRLYEHQWLVPRLPCISGHQAHNLRSATWRQRLLTPWLNLEVLKSDPTVLFSLLHCRVAYPPQDWALWDNRQLDLAWSNGYFDVNYSNAFVVISSPDYGKILHWDTDSIHQQDDIGFPRAQLLLEAQAYLMRFLCNVVDKILEGADLSKPASASKWEQLLSEGFRTPGESVLWSNYTHQAYAKPPTLSIKSLFSIAETSTRTIGDHLALLQCDPSYMRQYIHIIYQGELRKSFDANEMALLTLQEITEDILRCWKWKWVADKCGQVKKVYDQYHQSTSCSASLQTAYSDALWAFELFLVECFRGDIKRLRDTLWSRPGFLSYWKAEDYTTGTAKPLQIKRNKAPSFREDPLDWCLTKILEDPDSPQGYDHAMLFAFLQYHLTTSPRSEQVRLDEFLYQRLSGMASLGEMIVSIRLNRPQHGSRNITDELNQEKNIRLWKNAFLRPQFDHEGIGDPQVVANGLIDHLYRHRLSQGPKNPVWLQQSRPTGEPLGTFWADIRKWAKRYLKYLDLRVTEEKELMDVISVDLSSENNQLRGAEEKQTLSEIRSQSRSSQATLQTQWGSIEMKVPSRIPKLKVKSRFHSSQDTVEKRVKTPNNIDGHCQIHTYVTKNTLHVIRLMFPGSSEVAYESVTWENFLRAMCDAGFVAQNAGGSAVIFEAKDITENGMHRGKIVFHRPHPVPKLGPIMLRSMGKRMTKWFGWSRDQFRSK
ncbi:uncharacterized protein N7529_006010 [Penicillium soppii]|uniref:uncharacterized protein n=1 Tax=Penicillium soppii TaxID=69789 RepID=UPI0025466BE2|nr:uncharacterized protein N7529_006010 [Penicillium soppii]KAJ5864094.1 hypothetical protein N7529_006010 [Penicillium soppii]